MYNSGVVSERNDGFALRLDLRVLWLLLLVTDASRNAALGSLSSFLLWIAWCLGWLSGLGLQSLKVQLLNRFKLLIILPLT